MPHLIHTSLMALTTLIHNILFTCLFSHLSCELFLGGASTFLRFVSTVPNTGPELNYVCGIELKVWSTQIGSHSLLPQCYFIQVYYPSKPVLSDILCFIPSNLPHLFLSCCHHLLQCPWTCLCCDSFTGSCRFRSFLLQFMLVFLTADVICSNCIL